MFDATKDASYLSFGTLGRVPYTEAKVAYNNEFLDNSRSFPASRPEFSAVSVELPAGLAAPGLLGQLASKAVVSNVNLTDRIVSDLNIPEDIWSFGTVGVTGFRIKRVGSASPKIALEFKAQEVINTLTDRTTIKPATPTTPATPATTYRASHNLAAGTSSTPVFKSISGASNFTLVITQGTTSFSLPIDSASWQFDTSIDAPRPLDRVVPGDFELSFNRTLMSPGLLSTLFKQTALPVVNIVRTETVNGAQVERYRWELTNSYVSSLAARLLPRANTTGPENEVLRLRPDAVRLVTPPKVAGQSPLLVNLDFKTLAYSASNPTRETSPVQKSLAAVSGDDTPLTGVADWFSLDSMTWGGQMVVSAADSAGQRTVTGASTLGIGFQIVGAPNTTLIFSATVPTTQGDNTYPAKNFSITQSTGSVPESQFALMQDRASASTRALLITSYAYRDSVSEPEAVSRYSTLPRETQSFDFLSPTNIGTPVLSTSLNWHLRDASKTTLAGFGGQRAPAIEPMILEITSGGVVSQAPASGYSFAIDSTLKQPVGRTGAPTTLTRPVTPSKTPFFITTEMNNIAPGLLSAIAGKTLIPQIKVIERRSGPTGLVPFREWTLTNVYVEKVEGTQTVTDFTGPIVLALNPGSVRSAFITYNAAGTPTTTSRVVNFIAPPIALRIGPQVSLSTQNVVIDLPTRFTDEQQASSALTYRFAVVSGNQFLTSATLDATNKLTLDFVDGLTGSVTLAITVTDRFGLSVTDTFTVSVDGNGRPDAPVAANKTITMSEDSSYSIAVADFGFSDPNDSPSNVLTRVQVLSLPARGSLTLGGAAVAVNAFINVADIAAGNLRFTPVANANGVNYASFAFRVQDDGNLALGGANLSVNPNTLTFNVDALNDAPVISLALSEVRIPDLVEDAAPGSGILTSALAAMISDVDVGALKGIAVIDAPTTSGTWQYALDGVTYQNMGQ